MSESVIIYRIEHSGCPVGDVHHGPQINKNPHSVNGRYLPWFTEAPPFGAAGPSPNGDQPPLPTGDGLRCGVLRHQVSRWWSITPPTHPPKDWSFAVYKVATHLLHLAERQVVFPIPPESIFLGYFPGWVYQSGELDGRWPDSAFLQPNSRVALSTPPTFEEPSLHKDSIDALRSERILKGVGSGWSRLTFPSSNWVTDMSA